CAPREMNCIVPIYNEARVRTAFFEMLPHSRAANSCIDISSVNTQIIAMPFAKLGLSGPVLEGVKAMGYVDPTPIQLRAIPLILEGKDVIGSAPTGTGKTRASPLPIILK